MPDTSDWFKDDREEKRRCRVNFTEPVWQMWTFFSRLTNVKFATPAQEMTFQRELLELKHKIFPRVRFTRILQNRHPHSSSFLYTNLH
jgi:hypothetical protein